MARARRPTAHTTPETGIAVLVSHSRLADTIEVRPPQDKRRAEPQGEITKESIMGWQLVDAMTPPSG
jgi:hypothetical protein